MKIKDMDGRERPREKLMASGPRALSDSELLAILLRTGSGGVNVLELSRCVLAAADWKLCGLGGMSLERLCAIKGIGPDKAVTVAACFELARRWGAERTDLAKVPVRDPRVAYRIMAPRLRGLDHEELWIMYLNRSKYVMGVEMLSSGGLSSTTLDIARIIRRTLDKNASSVILFHNHPSENPMPGDEDIRSTESLHKAFDTVGKTLSDHIVVTDGSFYSFAMECVCRDNDYLLNDE